jgi:hypothetical protein
MTRARSILADVAMTRARSILAVFAYDKKEANAQQAEEHQKHRLEYVLGILPVMQHVATDAQYHRSMALHQRGKRGFVAGRNEPLYQLHVR